MTTIKDVAAKAGVSISTVSFVLNGKAKDKRVAEDTCRKVLEAAAALGYQPNASARKLRFAQEEKPVIAFYWPLDDRTSYLSVILNGLRAEIERLSFNCDLIIKTYKNDHLCEEKELCGRFQYSAAIIGAASAADMEYLEQLNTPLPLILFNRQTAHHHSVIADDHRAVMDAVQTLSSKGCEEIALFSSDHSFIAADHRLHLLKQCCQQAGIRIPEANVFHAEDSCRGGTIAARSFLRLENRPSTVFSMTDTIALGASYLFQREGLRLPEDLELISFGIGDPDAAKYAVPSLSILEMPTKEMARNAIDIARQVICSPFPSAEIQTRRTEARLILRETCPE